MIPRVFHHVWVGDPMPDHLAAYVATWREHHPGWDHRLWTEHDLTWLENQRLFNDAPRWTKSVGQFRSDIARYEILNRFGGVYVDCDMECRHPIDDLIADTECFAGWESYGVWVNNAVLGCVPGHPLMVELIEKLPANVEATRGKRPNVATGPQFLTPLARAHDITIFPEVAFYPYRWDELERAGEDFPGSWAVHHWNNKRKGQPVGV